VEAGYLGHDAYTEELLKGRLKIFCSHYRSFSEQCVKVVQQSGLTVLCDESRLKKFLFLYLARVTLLTPAQVRLRIGSGLLTLRTFSGRLRRSMQSVAALALSAYAFRPACIISRPLTTSTRSLHG